MEEAYAFIDKFLEEHPLEKIPKKDILELFRYIDKIIQILDEKSPGLHSFFTYSYMLQVLSRFQIGQLVDLQAELENRNLEFDVDLGTLSATIMKEALQRLPAELKVWTK